jgi:hypothetical protein
MIPTTMNLNVLISGLNGIHRHFSTLLFINPQNETQRLQCEKLVFHDDTVLCESQLRSFHETGRPVCTWNIRSICGERIASISHSQNPGFCQEAQYPFRRPKYRTRVSGMPLDLHMSHITVFAVIWENQPVPTRSQYGRTSCGGHDGLRILFRLVIKE